MKQRKLGDSDLLVSEYCLGAMYFGWKEPKEQSMERLNQFTVAGGNFIDTANMYAEYHKGDKDYFGKDFDSFVDGGSERLLGQWMKERKNRQDLIIATKLGCRCPGVEYGTSRKQIFEECEKSLRRLQTDYIDLLYLHIDDRATPLEESLSALGELIKQGKVRQIGASNFTAWRLAQAEQVADRLGVKKYCCIQQRYSYLRAMPGQSFLPQLAVSDDMLDYLKNSDTTLIAYSPLLGGYYNNRSKQLLQQYVGPDTDARLSVLDAIAKEVHATPVQIVYAWLMQSSPSALPLVASSTKEQFDEALGALEIKLTDAQLGRLNAAKYLG